MKLSSLEGKRILIWGLGREGLASADFIRYHFPAQHFIFAQDSTNPLPATILEALGPHDSVIQGHDAIARALNENDIIVKSPGVSLYHPLLQDWLSQGKPLTSLLNLWFAGKGELPVILVSGTKGKSTTSALLAHVLGKLGQRVYLAGNIGVPLGRESLSSYDIAVIETSSFQAATFDGDAALVLMTSLYPEHLDWHGDSATYFRDKLSLLRHARCAFAADQVRCAVPDYGFPPNVHFSGEAGVFHRVNDRLYLDDEPFGLPDNAYLRRGHNLGNCCLVLSAALHLGFDPARALAAMADFKGLPHRQFELGEKAGILYVDDSISTTPQSAIAALEAYQGRPVTLLAGGYDRGLDYAPLAAYVFTHPQVRIICMGACGHRIATALESQGTPPAFVASSFEDAVRFAQDNTPSGGVILLSPAAPSYDMFTDFTQRGQIFAQLCGITACS